MMSGTQLGLNKYSLGRKKEKWKQAKATNVCLNKQKLLSKSKTQMDSRNGTKIGDQRGEWDITLIIIILLTIL